MPCWCFPPPPLNATRSRLGENRPLVIDEMVWVWETTDRSSRCDGNFPIIVKDWFHLVSHLSLHSPCKSSMWVGHVNVFWTQVQWTWVLGFHVSIQFNSLGGDALRWLIWWSLYSVERVGHFLSKAMLTFKHSYFF